MNKNIKKLNITNKLVPIVLGGFLVLTGCGNDKIKDSATIEPVNASTISNDETIAVITDANFVSNSTTSFTTSTGKIINTDNTTKSENKETEIIDTTSIHPTTANTDSEVSVKHSGEAGYNEFNNRLLDIMGDYNTYSYISGFEEYIAGRDDTLKSIADKFNTTVGYLIDDNHLTDDKIVEGQVLKYRVKDEYINVKAGNDFAGIAIAHGIPIEDVLKLNDIPSYNCDTPIGKDSAIKLHRYIGNESRYQTNTGVVNVIYDNRILGEDVLFARGFAGCSQFVLVKNSSLSGTSAATLYSFDGDCNILNYEMVCTNPKRIDSIDGIPVAYLRTVEDLQELADAYGIELSDVSKMQWESVNFNNYPVHITEDGEQFITFDGRILDGYDMISNKTLTK